MVVFPVTIACEGGSITGVDSACAGTGPYLFTESVPAGTWSSSNTAVASIDAGGNVYAGSPGVATIIFTQSPGCTAVFSFTSNPTPAIISGGGTICQNATTTYTGSLSGGTWGSSNGGVADVLISAGTTATVEGVGSGTSSISYTVFGCPGAPNNFVSEPFSCSVYRNRGRLSDVSALLAQSFGVDLSEV